MKIKLEIMEEMKRKGNISKEFRAKIISAAISLLFAT